MVFNRHIIRISFRLGIIFVAMLALALMIGQEARLFSVLAMILILIVLIAELFHKINRTNRIIDRNEALTRFIANYRQFYRLPEPHKKEMVVSELLSEVTGLYQARCSEKGLDCSIHPGHDKLMVPADDAQLKQVLINIIKNALEALEEISEPRLEIAVKRVLNHILVEISDNGTGIPAA